MCYNENAFSVLSKLNAVYNIRLLEGLPFHEISIGFIDALVANRSSGIMVDPKDIEATCNDIVREFAPL